MGHMAIPLSIGCCDQIFLLALSISRNDFSDDLLVYIYRTQGDGSTTPDPTVDISMGPYL